MMLLLFPLDIKRFVIESTLGFLQNHLTYTFFSGYGVEVGVLLLYMSLFYSEHIFTKKWENESVLYCKYCALYAFKCTCRLLFVNTVDD